MHKVGTAVPSLSSTEETATSAAVQPSPAVVASSSKSSAQTTAKLTSMAVGPDLTAEKLNSTSLSSPASSKYSSTSVAVLPSSALPGVTVPTNGLSEAEIADRTAIEAMWLKYWHVTIPILRVKGGNREALLRTVATSPQVEQLLDAAMFFEKSGWDNYGYIIHHIYWGPPVDGASSAIMGDCMDLSHAGRLVSKTEKVLTVGGSHSNVRGLFRRLGPGVWRVYGLEDLGNTPC